MEPTIERAIGRVIETMRENLSEQLTVDDMARTAMFSKFHFSRLFQRVTGVSPGRFLSALRLQEAKQLLVDTTLTVTEVSHRVGYSSVGTFSYRFTRSVGVSPSSYRQLGGFSPTAPADRRRPAAAKHLSGTVHGEVWSTAAEDLGLIFVGLFADPIPRGQPVRCSVLHRTGPYRLDHVPPGTWYLLAHSVAAGLEEAVRGPLGEAALRVGSHGPVKVGADTAVIRADVPLRPVPGLEPPVVRALLDVRSVALTVGAA